MVMSRHIMSRHKEFTIRYFSRNLYSCLEDLPVIVTKWGVPYLKIERYDVTTNTTKDEIVTTQSDTTFPDVTTSKKEALKKVEKEVREIENSFSEVRSVPKPGKPSKKQMGFER